MSTDDKAFENGGAGVRGEAGEVTKGREPEDDIKKIA